MNPLEARRRLLGRNVYRRTTEGNPAIAQGSLARMYPGITMQGWTEQTQYEGNQLYDQSLAVDNKYQNCDTYNNLFIISDNDAYWISGKIPVKPNTTYSLNKMCNSGAFYSDENTPIDTIYIPASATITTPENCNFIVVNFEKSTTPFGTLIMLNEGSTALPYEPYTGDAPSPSPDYPQEIVSAGKYNEATGKWDYEVKLTRANLFDYYPFVNDDGYITSSYATSKQVSSPFHVKEGEKYVLITKGTNAVVNDYSSIYFGEDDLSYYDNNSKVLATGLNYNAFADGVQRRYVMTATKTCDITKCIIHGANYRANAYIVEEFGLFNYVDGVSENYEPYRTPQTVTLTSDRPLTKWDKLEKRNGQWGWVYKSDVLEYNGDEGWFYDANNTRGEYSALYYYDTRVLNKNYSYCDKFGHIVQPYDGEGIMDNHGASSSFYISIKSNRLASTDADGFKQWLSENPLTVLYETAEETFVPLTESEQEAMNALYTFRPTTVLSNDCDCNMSLTYKTKKSMEVTT